MQAEVVEKCEGRILFISYVSQTEYSVVCQYDTLVSPAKTDEPIQMPFGLRTRVGPRNHVLY